MTRWHAFFFWFAFALFCFVAVGYALLFGAGGVGL
jgi:hypothetical protein